MQSSHGHFRVSDGEASGSCGARGSFGAELVPVAAVWGGGGSGLVDNPPSMHDSMSEIPLDQLG